MKRFVVFLLFFALLLTACGQTSSYSPAVITSSRLEISSAPTAEDITNAAASYVVESIDSTPSAISTVESQQVSVATSTSASAENNSVVSSTSPAIPDSIASSAASSVSSIVSAAVVSSQQNAAANSAITSVKSSVPAAEGSSEIELVSVTSPIVRGQDAKITIKGKPDVEYTIKVIYKSGPSTAKGLEPKTCELNGLVTWSWKVSSRTTAGDWRIEISGDGASITVPFIVTQ